MSSFQQARNFEINNSTFIDASGGARSGLDMLRDNSIPAAAHDSYETESYKSSCLEGTRTQHIDDITAWTTRINQSSQHRLLWMWGPAGVGKSAIAKSCAEKTAQEGRLGASFFFSRTQHVDDPKRFFTTIAHQLVQKVDDYRRVLGSRIQHNQDLHTKGLDVQFHELIIAPFLELAERKMGVQDKTVIIDGLDECNGDPAQSKIMELVAKSVIEHGDKIPLLWVFFSRPESHINHEFSPYSSSHLFSKVELPMSESNDGDIRHYFRDKLRPLAYINTVWPSEDTLDILVSMVAGLWIYVTTLVKFIMDPDLFPEQQLGLVLKFHSQQEKRIQSITKSSVTGELDAFYRMIISRISPEHLPIVQQALLIHHTNPKTPDDDILVAFWSLNRPKIQLYVLANIVGHTVASLKHALSKLQSVLTFTPERERFWGEPFPGSAHISFYHASFMEFLLDKTRSGEYWLEDRRHYTALATKVLHLFKGLYVMNEISRDERILKLRELLPVFPDETFTPSQCFMFQDRLFYNVLCKYVSEWCEGSGLPSEVIGGFESTLGEFRPFFMDWVGMLPEEKQRLINSEERCYSQLELPEDNHTDARKCIKAIWDFITCCGCCRSDVLGRNSFQNPPLRIRCVSEGAKKLDFTSFNDVGLLAYYSYEWEAMEGTDRPTCMKLIEGDDHRLTKAACRLFDQRRDGHLILPWTYTRHLLRAFEASIGWTSMTELTQATKAYYSTVEGFVTGDPLLLNLRRVAGHITRERDMYVFRGGGVLVWENVEACVDILMNGHWEELIGKLEELLHATDDPDNYRMHIQAIIEYSSDGRQRLNSFLRLHVIKRVQEVMSSSSASGCASALVDLRQQLVKKAERIYEDADTIVDEAFEKVLRDYPHLRDAVNAQVSVLYQSFK